MSSKMNGQVSGGESDKRPAQQPILIVGGKHEDSRGALVYNNNFDPSVAKRFYTIHPTDDQLRGWQGHKIEQKWFAALQGEMLVLVVAPDDWSQPSAHLQPLSFTLQAGRGDMLHVPAGYATAFRPLSPAASIAVFSDLSLEESIADSYRFDTSLWYQGK